MGKRRNKTIDYMVYLLTRVVAMFVRMVPMPALYASGRALGRIAFVVDRRHRRRTVAHISQSFPDWDPGRVRQVAIQSLQSIVLLALETIITPQKINPSSFMRHVRFSNVERLLRRLIVGQTGVIVVTGHYGNWEMGGYTLATLGFPAAAVARPLDNRYVDRYIRGLRQKTGLRIVDKKGAAPVVDEILADKGLICFIADQDAGRKGVFVDFFGRPASTFKSIALLAIRYNVPIIVTYAKRLSVPFRFEIGVAGTITPEQWADRDDEVHWITQTYTGMLESLIRTDPGQYFGWAHRRWKHQPPLRKAE